MHTFIASVDYHIVTTGHARRPGALTYSNNPACAPRDGSLHTDKVLSGASPKC